MSTADSNTPSKTCLRCQLLLPVSSFSRHKNRPDGYQAYCKTCYRAANAKCEAANRARSAVPVPSEKRCARCGEVKSSSEFYADRRRRDGLYSNCRACHRVLTDDWKGDHPEDVKRIAKESYDRNTEARCQSSRMSRLANLAHYLAHAREYKLTHRAEATAFQRKRNARKRSCGGTHTAADVRAQYERQRGRCYYCGKKVAKDYHVDHVIPLTLGGSNGPENLVIACPACNCSKSAKHPMDFCGRLL